MLFLVAFLWLYVCSLKYLIIFKIWYDEIKKMINHHPLDIYKEDVLNSPNRVFVVGDIHGKYNLLKEGLEENKITENDFLIFAGDLINKGDDSIKVLDFVLTRPNTLCLYRNHESSFILVVDDTEKKRLDENGYKKEKLKDNLIIKGNNLLGLHSLVSKMAGTIDVIYIDPPYYFNETKKADAFAYNSNFKLS